MAVRINGVTFRSGCDINILMRSKVYTPKDTPEAREARIQKYAERFERGLPIFDDEQNCDLEDMSVPAEETFGYISDFPENFDEDMPSDYSGN